MNRVQITNEERDMALVYYGDVLASVPSLRLRGRNVPGTDVARALAGANLAYRDQIGRHLVRRFRRETDNPTGLIDWQKFHEWLQEHMAEINALRVILSILTILMML